MWRNVIRNVLFGILLCLLGGSGILAQHFSASHRFPPTPELDGISAVLVGVLLVAIGVRLFVGAVREGIDLIQRKPELWD